MTCLFVLLTLSIMHFQDSEPRNIVPQHNLISASQLVHALYDLKVAVSEVEVVIMDSHTPWVRQS